MNKKSCLLLGLLACLLISVSRADEYDTLRAKWKLTLTGGTGVNTSDPDIDAVIDRITAEAQDRWDDMLKTGGNGRAHLWSDLASTTISSHVTSSYTRLKAMALAYSTDGSPLEGNTALLNDIKGGLDWLYANRYNEDICTNSAGDDITPYDNTWDWRIGVPMAYNDIMVMLYDAPGIATQMTNYTAAVEVYSRDTFYTSGSSTGANKVWRCMVAGLYGVLAKNSAKLAMARDHLVAPGAVVFDHVESGDGFYWDGSFIQHQHHPYNGGYGVVALYYGAELLNLLAGSTWAVTDKKANNIFDWVYRAYEPFIYKGIMFTSVMGRNAASYDTSRQAGVSDHLASHKVVWALIRLSEFAPPADAAAYQSMVKHWVSADTSPLGFYADASVDVTIKAKAIVANSAVPNRGEIFLYKQYPGMDRVAAHRPGYALGLSLSSARVYNYESINNQNLKGWNTGSGMSYLYNADGDQFTGNYWATVNPYRLPGTTVLQATTVAHRKLNGQAWVGGADLRGLFGVTGMQFRWPDKSLYAKKSWFVLDDEIVALGADIDSNEAGKVVESVIENRKLNASGSNAFLVNGVAQPTTLVTTPTVLTGVNWAHLAGNVTGSDIGYYFPGSATISSRREARTGNWKTIDNRTNVPTTPVTDNYLNFWFDHGTGTVANATYAYVLLPNKTSAQVSSYASSPNITVLENSGEAQGVKDNTIGLTAINFWLDAPKTLGDVTSSLSSSFIMHEDEGMIDIGVSDPTQNKTGTIAYTINRAASSVDEELSGPGITVTQLSPTIQFTAFVTSSLGTTNRLALNVPVVVDNDNANNTGGSLAGSTGTWVQSTGAGDWGTDYRHDNNQGEGTKTFTFTPNLPVAGKYEVQIWHVAHAWRSDKVPVDVIGSNGPVTVEVDQQINGSQWVSLGEHAFAAGTGGRVVVRTTGTTGTNTYVVADAVRFVRVPPVIVTVDNAGNTDGSTAIATGSWATSSSSGRWGSSFAHDNKTGKGVGKYFTFTPNLPSAGNYQVLVWHPAQASRAPNVPVKITSNSGTTTVTVNQQVDRDQWVPLGVYPFSAGMVGSVKIETAGTSTDYYVTADAVRFVKQ